jgi:NADH dehydrogenase (ubiquinone) Fe-S protein 6
MSSRFANTIVARHFSVTRSKKEVDLETHTGQKFDADDYRRARFLTSPKLVNERFALKLIQEEPVIVCTQRVVASDSGGALGHPRVYINLDAPEVHTCGYSGRRFVLKKYYNEKTMGPSITYEKYLKDIGHTDD